MKTESGIVFAGLMPHAPVLVPSIGSGRLDQLQHTIEAMREVARRALAQRPDSVVVISPHSPFEPNAFAIWSGAKLHGSFARFGSDVEIDLPIDRPLAERLEDEAKRRGQKTWRITATLLDHGAMVPLSYLVEAGWSGPTLIVGIDPSIDAGLEPFGVAIGAAVRSLDRRVALIASGDMSHRLSPTGPYGYDPIGPRFDHQFTALLDHGTADDFRRLDHVLCEEAAEDVVAPTRLALAASGFPAMHHAILSYEGPFGVGYGVAILAERPVESAPFEELIPAGAVLSDLTLLPRVARAAVEAKFDGGPLEAPYAAAGELGRASGVFVSVHTLDGDLRGCRGAPRPTRRSLLAQTWRCARDAVFNDPRFLPLSREELPRIRFTVSVLDPLEPVGSLDELDPAKYGVVVTAADGCRRGLLLPAIEGIDGAANQVFLAKRKAGIGSDERVRLERFTTRVFDERRIAS